MLRGAGWVKHNSKQNSQVGEGSIASSIDPSGVGGGCRTVHLRESPHFANPDKTVHARLSHFRALL